MTPSSAASGDSFDGLRQLWALLGGESEALDRILLHGEAALPSSFRLGILAQSTIGAVALMASEIHRMRKANAGESVSVEARHALAEFRSERYLRLDGGPAPELWDAIAGAYQAGDGRWLRLHTNFPHHRDGVLKLLDCGNDRTAVAAALLNWSAEAFEAEAARRGLVVAMMRSFEEWDNHPQGQTVAKMPPVIIEKLEDNAPEQLPDRNERPLGGLRVLDLSRIIAGPVTGRALAAHGADVMRISAPHLPFIAPLVMDTGRGKLSAYLNITLENDLNSLKNIVNSSDVFLQAYRPGALQNYGLGPEDLAALRPGLIYGSLSAYGHEGPWAERRGFDSLVQTASGFNAAEAQAAGTEGPKPLPCQALDHATGYLLAAGILAALKRRAEQGGSWHVRVSLAATGRWLRSFGRAPNGFAVPDQKIEELTDLMEDSLTPFGKISAIKHAGRLSANPPYWERPSVPLGTHKAAWPE
ncbi:MAG: CoA transferase [Kiloniellales bacterium]|nr:CoA transferase [Kiloniellales bacterium]